MTPVLPYPPDTNWTFAARTTGYERTIPLELHWEVEMSPYSDDFSPDETPAIDLWGQWLAYLDRSDPWLDALGRPWLRILWFVTSPVEHDGVFEGAPHEVGSLFEEDFLTHFSHPWNDFDGEVNWLRLPVRDLQWNTDRDDKGGFIQEATGWKPSALQPAVNLAQIAAASGRRAPREA